jgi:RNA recognition motif-containing protein
MLKNFNLVNDPQNPGKNKGYAFFEYYDVKCAERAIKLLNEFEFGDKKLKVQKAAVGSKVKDTGPKTIGFQKYVSDED